MLRDHMLEARFWPNGIIKEHADRFGLGHADRTLMQRFAFAAWLTARDGVG